MKNRIFYLFFMLIFIFGCSTFDKSNVDGVKTSDKKETARNGKVKSESAKKPLSMKWKWKGGDDIEGASGMFKEKSAFEHKKSRGVTGKSASGLKAGFADDNKQFNYYLNFLNEKGNAVQHIPVNIRERIVIKVRDNKGKPVANALVMITSGGKTVASGKTYADGTFLFFPSEYGNKPDRFKCTIEYSGKKKAFKLDRQGKRNINVKLDLTRKAYQNVPLDILFIMDTTGSMGEEIQRLKNTIEIINLNLSSLSIKPLIRFGMVLYKDRNDEYVTRIIPLTNDLESFRKQLGAIEAGGGGDLPEDLQSALSDTLKKIKWNADGIRLCYIITDAPPHIDYEQEYTYINSVHDARKKGIKIFSVGTGGLNLMGEYILRQISQYTYAKYIFLTYGEKGESQGGREGSVSHHTGANFTTDRLESIIIRFTKEELSHLSDIPLEKEDPYIEAVKVEYEKNEETLKKLFDMSVSQLVDYSSINLGKDVPATIIPLIPDKETGKTNAEYFTEQLLVSLSRNKTFKMVERKNLQEILKEHELQMTGLVDEKNAAKLGKIFGAKLIIGGKIYKKKSIYEIFLKLIRVETSEVLSVNKLKIDGRLTISK